MYIKKSYPDGTFYPLVEEFKEEFIFSINSYSDLWLLKQIKDVYDYNNKNATVIIPNLLDAQADRRFNDNESHNLKLVLHELNNMNWKIIKIFHPHNPEIVEAIINKIEIIDNSKFINQIINNYIIKTGDDINNLILMSSDAGGFKPLMKLANKIKWQGETFSASKSRKHEKGISVIIQQIDKQDFEGKDILIIDDICVYGGTFIGLAKLLKQKNIGKLYLAVSHLTVDKPNPELFKYFDKVFTTDSKGLQYVNEFSNQPNNLTIIKLFN